MNRIFFSIGNINIYWYSILILIGIIIGYILIRLEIKRLNKDKNFIDNLLFYTIIVGIIGARLYYVIFNYKQFDNILDILAIYNGGLAIYGAVIAGIIFIYIYCRKHNKRFLLYLDIMSASLILAQAIGRWGNFFNKEAYGSICSLDFLKSIHIPNFIINNMYINGAYHHPTFLYESIWCLLGFIIIMLIRYKVKNKKVGIQTYFYLIFYGIGRFFIESIRVDSLYLSMLRVSQIVSLIIILIGIIGMIKLWKKE